MTSPSLPSGEVPTEQMIEAIRQKCVEANPEIMKLDFGCEITATLDEDDGPERWKFVRWSDDMARIEVVCACCQCQIGEICWSDDTCEEDYYDELSQEEIIKRKYDVHGRPIRLADILVACFNGGPVNLKAIKERGHESFIIALGNGGIWNLFKDSLDEQSPETIAFLHSLLCQ